jgi:hypothetical protein
MDFLTFKNFISIEVLILFYYLGALIFPMGIWMLLAFLIRKYKLFDMGFESSMNIVWHALNRNQKTKFIVSFVIVFLFMELFWRMLFEFLIAYMQMRDALLQLSTG